MLYPNVEHMWRWGSEPNSRIVLIENSTFIVNVGELVRNPEDDLLYICESVMWEAFLKRPETWRRVVVLKPY